MFVDWRGFRLLAKEQPMVKGSIIYDLSYGKWRKQPRNI